MMKDSILTKISTGNRKMGEVPSVSLPPFVTCCKNAPCKTKCYVNKFYRMYPAVRAAYDYNLKLYQSDPALYFAGIAAAAKKVPYFRYHVSGDIVDYTYLKYMLKVARICRNTEFLVFTKKYDIINEYCRKNGASRIPENMHILFSFWDHAWNQTIDNRYQFPECHVILKNENDSAENYGKVCGGNCTNCACHGVGCWTLKHGETLAIIEH